MGHLLKKELGFDGVSVLRILGGGSEKKWDPLPDHGDQEAHEDFEDHDDQDDHDDIDVDFLKVYFPKVYIPKVYFPKVYFF